MIKCNVTISGTVSKAAQVRNNRDGKPFTTFGVAVVILNPQGINKTVEVSVIKDGAENTSDYVVGNRIEMTGELTFRKREDNLFFNFSAQTVNLTPASTEDGIKGELTMKGTSGKNIEQKQTRTGKSMLIFSAYSGEKTEKGFAFTWVRFVQFGYGCIGVLHTNHGAGNVFLRLESLVYQQYSSLALIHVVFIFRISEETQLAWFAMFYLRK